MNCYIRPIEIISTEDVYSIHFILCPVLTEVIYAYLSSATTTDLVQQLAQRQQAEKSLHYENDVMFNITGTLLRKS